MKDLSPQTRSRVFQSFCSPVIKRSLQQTELHSSSLMDACTDMYVRIHLPVHTRAHPLFSDLECSVMNVVGVCVCVFLYSSKCGGLTEDA